MRAPRQSFSPSIDLSISLFLSLPQQTAMTHHGPARVSCERLITLVQERPPLYDYSHPAHCNRDVTTYMWSQVAAELDTTEVICKTKWANLRSNFVRELRRIHPSEDGTVWAPQWPLFKPLMFLLPFLKKRGSTSPGIDESTRLDFQESKKQSTDFLSEQIPKRIHLESVPAEEETNDDKLFMLSLVPKMRQLPTEDNIKFRIEVQQLLLNKLCKLTGEYNPTKPENGPQELAVKVENNISDAS